MIARILEQQQAICGVLAEDRGHCHCMPSPHDFTVLEAVSSVLQPLQVFLMPYLEKKMLLFLLFVPSSSTLLVNF